jgi:AP-3 complex subunit delta-1
VLVESRLPSLRTTSQTFSSQPFVVDKDGEMPEGAVMSLPQPALTSGPSTTPAQLISFPPSDYPDTPRSQTPDPITVMRTKKKGAGGKKRTAPTPAR